MTPPLTTAEIAEAQRLVEQWLGNKELSTTPKLARYARHLEAQASRADLHSFVDDDYGSEFCKTCGHSIIGHKDGPISRAEPSGSAKQIAEQIVYGPHGAETNEEEVEQITQALDAAKRSARAEALEAAENYVRQRKAGLLEAPSREWADGWNMAHDGTADGIRALAAKTKEKA